MKAQSIIYNDRESQKEFHEALLSVHHMLPPEDLREILESYEITPSQIIEVIRFLLHYSYLVQVLLDALPKLKEVFGEFQVYLELERDPDENFEELFGVIKVNATPEKALALLTRFDKVWFTQIQWRTLGKFNFTVETTNDESV